MFSQRGVSGHIAAQYQLLDQTVSEQIPSVPPDSAHMHYLVEHLTQLRKVVAVGDDRIYSGTDRRPLCRDLNMSVHIEVQKVGVPILGNRKAARLTGRDHEKRSGINVQTASADPELQLAVERQQHIPVGPVTEVGVVGVKLHFADIYFISRQSYQFAHRPFRGDLPAIYDSLIYLYYQ